MVPDHVIKHTSCLPWQFSPLPDPPPPPPPSLHPISSDCIEAVNIGGGGASILWPVPEIAKERETLHPSSSGFSTFPSSLRSALLLRFLNASLFPLLSGQLKRGRPSSPPPQVSQLFPLPSSLRPAKERETLLPPPQVSKLFPLLSGQLKRGRPPSPLLRFLNFSLFS